MKKILAAVLIAIFASAFSQEWYSTKERIGNLLPKPAAKDTSWYSYIDSPAYVWTLKTERATYFNVNDFGLEYPVNLHALSAYLYDSLQTYSYKIYGKDGSTLLFQSPEGISVADYNDYDFETPLILTDDFWFSVVPQTDGLPRHVSSDVISSDHSFYGYAGDWKPFYNETDRYEWVNYVALSPFEGDDIYPPILRSVSGLNNFMGYDAVIAVSVQDLSGVVSPMAAQYDIGSGWIDFELNELKSTHTFAGTIPGQPNGVTGPVRFYMEDTVGNSAWSDEYTVKWGTDIPLLSEGFENGFPPVGWSLETAGAGFVNGELADGGFVYEGKWSAVHWDDMGWQDDWLITTPVALPPAMPATLAFWQTTYWSYYYGLSEVSISTDKVNWTKIYEPPYVADDEDISLYYDGLWIPAKISLNDYAGQTVYIGFHYQGDFNHQWYIDNVELVIDNDVPEIKNIYANKALLPDVGAYLNNPMELFVEVYDFTGTKSVVGHYALGGAETYTDIVFTPAGEAGLWTAAIPPESAAITGEIYFTLEDEGGVSGNSVIYNIAFVEDTGAPEVTFFSFGSPVFVGDDMTLELTFEDESGINSVQGYYSKDNWVTQTPFAMTASKIHEYKFTGTIPAETEETFAEVKFTVTDVPGNVLNTPAYKVSWLLGTIVFFDDFEGSNPEETWYTDGGNWGYVTNEYFSPNTSLHDSPAGDYGNNLFNPVRTRIFDFSGAYGASMFLWAKVDIETGWDYCYLQATVDEFTWTTLYEFNGEDKDWEFHSINLGTLALQPSVRLRFRMVTDAAVVCDGIYIDDVALAVYNKDYLPPFIEYSGPEVFTATGYVIPREFTIPVGLDDYTFSVKLTDISDISEVKVVYTVDGGDEQVSIPAVSSGTSGTYELTIPAQPAGSKVWYKIVATDNSEYKNSGESRSYMIRFGNFLCYQNGDDFTDYLDIIGNTPQASAQAIAKRVTMGPMDGEGLYRSSLVGITIDNYIATDNGYPSDPMHVHVWADDGGKPGADIIEPIYTVQASTDISSYEITYVDLRPYSAQLSDIVGDVFVGYTSAGDVTNILYEVVGNRPSTVPGYIAFERSWLGTGDLSALNWTLDPASVYHISAVIGEYELVGIENNDNIPVTTMLYQNYPNPFNPETTIKFSIAADSDVKLSVFNSKGEKVTGLLNTQMKKGAHEIRFDGAGLTSGIYYSVLQVNGKAMTKKMIMLK